MILRLPAFVIACVLCAFSLLASAEGFQTAITSIIPSNHRLVFNQHKEEQELKWVLSSIKKINGRWRYDESAKTEGFLTNQTYEFDDVDREALTAKIEALAGKRQWELLFGCDGMACGRSYGWSEIFSNKTLHGIDSTQRYWVWQTKSAWYSAFIVERGNRRVYLQWLELTLTQDAPLALSDQNVLSIWNNQGFAVLPRESASSSRAKKNIDVSTEDLELLKHWIEAQTYRDYAVVGHNQKPQYALSQQESKSLDDAQAVLALLAKELTGYSFKAYGLGPIAPRRGIDARVEIVPLSRAN